MFRRYKAYLRRAYQAKQLRASSQDVTAVDLIRILLEIIRHVLQGIAWEKSFADNGYTLHQVNTCHRIRDLLPNLVVPTLPDSEFCFADICSVLPRKRGYDRNLLWPETLPEIQAHEDPVLVDVAQEESDPMLLPTPTSCALTILRAGTLACDLGTTGPQLPLVQLRYQRKRLPPLTSPPYLHSDANPRAQRRG